MQVTDFLQITPDNPLVITTGDGLRKLMLEVLKELGVHAQAPVERAPIATEMPRKLAKKYLQEKGHLVKSDLYFRMMMDDYGIVPTKRGRDHWYKLTDLDKIPARV